MEEAENDDTKLGHLAGALRYMASHHWSEGVRSHFSVELDRGRIAIQSELVDWSRMRPQDLVQYCARETSAPPHGVSASAFATHTLLHRRLGRRAACVLHLHPPHATLLACTLPGRLEMVHQNCAYFYNLVGYCAYPATGTETVAGGMDPVLEAFGECNRVVVHANHGVTVIGESVHCAFDDLVYFETACRIYLQAFATGMRLAHLPSATCERIVAMRNQDRHKYARMHLDTVMSRL